MQEIHADSLKSTTFIHGQMAVKTGCRRMDVLLDYSYDTKRKQLTPTDGNSSLKYVTAVFYTFQARLLPVLPHNGCIFAAPEETLYVMTGGTYRNNIDV